MQPTQKTPPRPLVLMIIDGFGISFLEEGNAIHTANTEHINSYIREYPMATINASGIEVGLPWGEAGNSEVGHKNMGSGKIIYQPLPQITLAIRNGSFFENPAFMNAVEHVKQNPDAALHIMGCASSGGVHSHIDHLLALLTLAERNGINKRTFIHAFLDGIDAPPISAGQFLSQINKLVKSLGIGGICTVTGRYYAMDRNKNWDRTQAAYDAMVHGKGKEVSSWEKGLEWAYDNKYPDDRVPPLVIEDRGNPVRTVKDGDAIIFFNYRPDRARQITEAFAVPTFSNFSVEKWKNLNFITMSEYQAGLPVTVAFPEEYAEHPLGKAVSDAGLRQLRIAETEKYAHVTYYLNSGRELPYPGEDRILIPSPNVKDYAKTPAMSADAITNRVIREIKSGKYDFIAMNYANPDMIGHTGDFDANVEALRVLDSLIHRLIQEALQAGGAVLLTSDHGNAEEMVNPADQKPTKGHSSNPVPLVYIAPHNKQNSPKSNDILFQILSTPIGVLADVAPTVLEILDINPPEEMTAQSLLESLV